MTGQMTPTKWSNHTRVGNVGGSLHDGVAFQIIVLDSLLLWGGVVDEIDFATRLSQWANSGFPELGDSVGWGIGRTVGKVYFQVTGYMSKCHTAMFA